MPIFRYLRLLLRRHNYLRLRLVQMFSLVLFLNIFFGLLYFLVERHAQPGLDLLDSIWWAMVTMTTVGYGDLYPHTNIGRFLIAYPCMLVGIAIIGYFLGLAAESIFDHISNKKRGLVQITKENHIIICNFPDREKILRMTAELKLHPAYENALFVIISDTIDKLPENQKTAFTLHKYEDLSYKEISDILNTSLSSVESLMHRAKKNLQKKLENYYKSEKI